MPLSSRRSLTRIIVPWSVLLAAAGSASAHNTWLLASPQAASQPTSVRLALITTEHFPTSEYKTSPERVAAWITRVGQEQRDVRGYKLEGLELVASADLNRPGVYVIAAELHPRFIEFEGGYFNEYLADERAEEALSRRKQAGESDKPGRMFYTKLVKTFVELGDEPGSGYDVPVGHTLEIIPLSNPCHWRTGDRVKVRVLYEGKPAAHVRVSSGHEHMAEHTHRKSESHDYVENVFTDAAGEATLTLGRPGLWFFRTHLIRPMRDKPSGHQDARDADWESFWSSITFQVGSE